MFAASTVSSPCLYIKRSHQIFSGFQLISSGAWKEIQDSCNTSEDVRQPEMRNDWRLLGRVQAVHTGLQAKCQCRKGKSICRELPRDFLSFLFQDMGAVLWASWSPVQIHCFWGYLLRAVVREKEETGLF